MVDVIEHRPTPHAPTPRIARIGSRQINALNMRQHQIKGDCSHEFVVEGAGWVHQNGGWQLAADAMVWLMFYVWDGRVEWVVSKLAPFLLVCHQQRNS